MHKTVYEKCKHHSFRAHMRISKNKLVWEYWVVHTVMIKAMHTHTFTDVHVCVFNLVTLVEK